MAWINRSSDSKTICSQIRHKLFSYEISKKILTGLFLFCSSHKTIIWIRKTCKKLHNHLVRFDHFRAWQTQFWFTVVTLKDSAGYRTAKEHDKWPFFFLSKFLAYATKTVEHLTKIIKALKPRELPSQTRAWRGMDEDIWLMKLHLLWSSQTLT